ncbi:MAG: hypothetical protein ACW98W_20485 [Candidatus Hodarchaeales archaeon]
MMKTIKKFLIGILKDVSMLGLVIAGEFYDIVSCYNIALFIVWTYSVIKIIIGVTPIDYISVNDVIKLKLEESNSFKIYNKITDYLFVFLFVGIGWIFTGIILFISRIFFEEQREKLLEKANNETV